MPQQNELPLFVVEDSDDDLFLFRRLLAKADVTNPLQIATNGQSAIDQLQELVTRGEAARLPRIVFLDLKLPLRSGFDVLQWIRAQPALSQTVVMILSSSAEARDVKRAYELGAHGYLVKYPHPSVFRDVVRTVAMLPANGSLAKLRFPGLTPPPS